MSQSLHIVSSMAPRGVLADLIDLYGKHKSIRIELRAAGGVDVTRRVSEGELVDLVVLARNAINQLIIDGHMRSVRCVDLMTSTIAAAVRAGDRRPKFSNEAEVRKAVLEANSIGYSTGPSGTYLEKLFTRWELFDSIRERIVVPPAGVSVAHLISTGQVALGFQQTSELLNISGVDVVAELPTSIQYTTTFSGAIARKSCNPDAANAFLVFSASPEVKHVKQRHGMDEAGQ